MNKRILIGIVIIAAAIIGIKMFTTTVENVATETTKDVLNNVVKANLKPVAAAIKNQQLCQSGADTQLQALGHEGQPLARSMAYIALAQESYLQGDNQKALVELQQSLDASGKKISPQQRDQLLKGLAKGAEELAAKRKQNGFSRNCQPL
ncbi:hypothetical protein CTM97_01430 [Photobacterium phosphoreum]|uniref:Uncharacterized protein n=1 Tax=Photobacterium phosphoreum TaxID=659 RepID=A0A2T3JUS6_PHOPO|nr:hypothetical protein [Photobacterium phosphoreum]PSU26206.1 hypothetical protein CTM96_06540 [Photobacterium phosphoreum]PSU44142.1 hypothetical protein CTM97_01430 [Photobacterium phosphoreum]PSU52982.1 hypothetical protein C9J18_06785 [Photobacterium phosphoreum]